MSIPLPGLPGLGESQPVVGPTAAISPEGLRAQREYAKALMYGHIGDKGGGAQFPVVQSWTQGLSNMANALMGGNEMYNANQREAAGQRAVPIVNPGGAPAKPSFSEGPASGGREKYADAADDETDASVPKGYAPGGYAAGMSKSNDPRGLASYIQQKAIENGVDPNVALRVARSEGLSDPVGDNRTSFGAFQLHTGGGMGDEFRRDTGLDPADPRNEKATIDYALSHVSQTGWHPWHGAAKVGVAERQGLGGQPATATAFAGPDGGSSANPAVQAISNVLQGKPQEMAADTTQVAAGKAAPGGRGPEPMPTRTGKIYIDPKLVQPRPSITREQYIASQRSFMPDADKQRYEQMYLQQGQPIDVPYQGGIVRIHPTDHSIQQFIAPDIHWGEKSIGDIKKPTGIIPGGQGDLQEMPQVHPPAPAVGPRSEVAPQQAPAAAPVAPVQPPPVRAGVEQPVAPQTPVAPAVAYAPEEFPKVDPTLKGDLLGPVPPVSGTQVASNDPNQAFAAGLGKEPLSPVEQQMMAMVGKDQPVAGVGPAGAPPPAAAGVTPVMDTGPKPVATPVAAPAPAAKPVGPLAQAIASKPPKPPDVSQEDWDSWLNLNQAKTGIEVAKHGATNKQDIEKDAATESNKYAYKKYDLQSTQGQTARKQMPNIDLALALASNKNFNSGLGTPFLDLMSKIKVAVLGDKYANAPNETFDKLLAATVLGQIKDVGGGQIRLPEITLLSKANANRSTTEASIRAVLNITHRSYEMTDHLDGMGQEYVSGGEVHNPITGAVMLKENIGPDGEVAPRRGLDAGYDKLARKFTTEHPAFNPDEIKHYATIFDTGRDPNEVAATPAGKAAGEAKTLEEVQPGQTYKGHLYNGGDKADQKSWSIPKAQ